MYIYNRYTKIKKNIQKTDMPDALFGALLSNVYCQAKKSEAFARDEHSNEKQGREDFRNLGKAD